MLYGVIAGLFKELDRNAATAEGAPVESARVEYLEAALDRAEGYSGAPPSAARSRATWRA